MKTKKIKIILSSILLLCIFALSSCDNKNTDSSKKTLEFWTIQLKPVFTDYINGLITNYQKNHPTIAIKWVDIPASEIEKKLLAAIAGNVAPDVVNLNTDFLSKLAGFKALASIDKLTTQRSQYFENIWQTGVIKGESYALPWYLSTGVTIYNKELFKAAGLDENAPPKTYEELYTMAKTLKEKTDKYMMMPGFADRDKMLATFVQQGTKVLSKEGKIAFQSAETRQAIQFWKRMIDEKLIPKESMTEGHRQAIDRFQSGDLGLLATGPQFLKIIQENSPQLYPKLGVGEQISGKSGLIGVAIMNLAFPKSSKHLKEAVQFGEYITNGENQLEFCKIVPILPSINKAAQDKYFKLPENPTLKDRARTLSAQQLIRATRLVPAMDKSAQKLQNFNDAIYLAIMGNKSPEEALKKAMNSWEALDYQR